MATRHFRLAALSSALLALATVSVAAQDPKEPLPGLMGREVSILHLLERAKTPADQEAIAQRFDARAAEFDKQAQEHEQLAQRYRKGLGVGPKGNAAALANHCENLIRNLRASATEARNIAQIHRNLAKSLAK